MIFYSIVKSGSRQEFHLYPIVSFNDIAASHGLKSKTLSELFNRRLEADRGTKVEVECSQLSKEDLRDTILGDLADLPDELKTTLESAIGEVF